MRKKVLKENNVGKLVEFSPFDGYHTILQNAGVDCSRFSYDTMITAIVCEQWDEYCTSRKDTYTGYVLHVLEQPAVIRVLAQGCSLVEEKQND